MRISEFARYGTPHQPGHCGRLPSSVFDHSTQVTLGSTGVDGTDMVIFQSKSIRVTVNVLKTVNANFSRENGVQRGI